MDPNIVEVPMSMTIEDLTALAPHREAVEELLHDWNIPPDSIPYRPFQMYRRWRQMGLQHCPKPAPNDTFDIYLERTMEFYRPPQRPAEADSDSHIIEDYLERRRVYIETVAPEVEAMAKFLDLFPESSFYAADMLGNAPPEDQMQVGPSGHSPRDQAPLPRDRFQNLPGLGPNENRIQDDPALVDDIRLLTERLRQL